MLPTLVKNKQKSKNLAKNSTEFGIFTAFFIVIFGILQEQQPVIFTLKIMVRMLIYNILLVCFLNGEGEHTNFPDFCDL